MWDLYTQIWFTWDLSLTRVLVVAGCCCHQNNRLKIMTGFTSESAFVKIEHECKWRSFLG